MTTTVSFEIAKLLKEKGFREPTRFYYEYALTEQKHEHDGTSGPFGWKKGELHLQDGFFENNSQFDGSSESWYLCSAPYLVELITWLYEIYDIWITSSYEINLETNKREWFWVMIKEGEEIAYQYKDFNSSKEAYEAAIEYYLKELL